MSTVPTLNGQVIGQAHYATRALLERAISTLGVPFNQVVAQHSAAATREQLTVQREGQLTDRYTRAVEQLANVDTTVRIGGIYALDRIARESIDDRPNIVNVLAAYLADLRGSDFTRALLDGADLTRATRDETTWWPDGAPEP
ncbi:pentapeptide repeat-containing protein [Micromonospora sp. NPDC050795]|uniref:pentapeptide repeat-containing protein n=1 Tax=Micromonospora sp. NPDC050795 TaxID=3364282 RepID=UPI0037AA9A90